MSTQSISTALEKAIAQTLKRALQTALKALIIITLLAGSEYSFNLDKAMSRLTSGPTLVKTALATNHIKNLIK